MDKTFIDGLFTLSNSDSLGTAYSGTWQQTQYVYDTLVITLTDVTSSLLTPGSTTFTVMASANLYNFVESGSACTDTETLAGPFTSPPAIVSFVAANAGSNVGADAGDTLTITFDQSTSGSGSLTATDLSTLIQLSGGASFGTDATGLWSMSDTVLTITLGSMSSGLAPLSTTATIKSGANLQDSLGGSGASTSGPVLLTGTLTSVPALTSVVASNTGNNIGAGPRDTIVLTFDQNTNGGAAVNPNDVSETELNTLLTIGSGSLGTQYRGVWNSARSTLTITIGTDTTGIVLVPGTTTFTLKAAGNVKDRYGSTAASTASATLSGTLTSAPAIVSATASNSGNGVGVNNGDTIVIVFDQGTDRAGFGSGATLDTTDVTSIVDVDMSSSLPMAMTAMWGRSSVTDDTLTITITDSSGAVLQPKITSVSIKAT